MFLTPLRKRKRSPSPRYSLWSDSDVPDVIVVDDSLSVVVGTRFQSIRDGYVIGVRFYKSPENTGIHIGTLWNDSGQNLGTVEFTNETDSGWQEALFASPIAISANTDYIISYLTNAGYYSANSEYFNGYTHVNGPLLAPASAFPRNNGIYLYSDNNAYPTDTFGNTFYWVDVIFE